MFFMPLYELKETKQPSSQRSQQSNMHFPIISVPVMIFHHLVNCEQHYLKKISCVQEKAQDDTKDYLGNTEDCYVMDNVV